MRNTKCFASLFNTDMFRKQRPRATAGPTGPVRRGISQVLHNGLPSPQNFTLQHSVFRKIQHTISIITLVTFLIVLDSAIITVGPHFGGQRERSDRPGRSGQDDRTGTPPGSVTLSPRGRLIYFNRQTPCRLEAGGSCEVQAPAIVLERSL